jgi:pyruvate dehydrogenase E2 component (dihydrolipoamide acetyltransferase)
VDLAVVHGTGNGGKVTRVDVRAAARPGGPERRPGRRRVSPYARRLARELGVDLAGLTGSGADGAVVAADVRRATTAARPVEPSVEPPVQRQVEPSVEAPVQRQVERTTVDRSAGMRHAIAQLMARSKREVPHYYLATTIDLARATDHVAQLNADRPVTARLVPAVLLLKATAGAARRVPQLNGFWVDDAFRPADHVHLGVAVSLRQGGLIAPAIHDADTLDLDTLMAALKDVVMRARGGRLRGSEMSDGTLTVTSLGDRGVEAVYGVIYPPQVGLVGFGRVVDRPWAVNGMLTVRPVVTATLSADHRATDGHIGGLYLAAVDELLQKPEEL